MCGLCVLLIAECVARHWQSTRSFPPTEALPCVTAATAAEARLIALELASRAAASCPGCCNCGGRGGPARHRLAGGGEDE